MEAVRAFNNELSSLYESKPPVSRAKMAQVTKCAIKAIKFYKHVVQSVEKFIQKCKPEYKVPGLYVIDSIVRQSRHQFGSDKDVFSPRFTKNIVTTFTNLFKCPVDERSRVVRVLNLWQKNNVFPMEVIQPLLDLAADPENPDLVVAAQRSVDAVVSSTQKIPLPGTQASSNGADSNQILQQTEMLATITKLLQQAQEVSLTGIAPESQLQQLQHLQQQLIMQTERISKPHQQPAPPIDSNLLAQIQVLTNQLLSKASGGEDELMGDAHKINSGEALFNKKLLDFDYGDSEEDDDRQEHHHHHHHHHYQQRPPPLMQQGMPPMMQDHNHLQQIQIQQMSQQQEQLQSEIGAQEQLRRRVLEQQQQQFDREIGQAAMLNLQPPHGFNENMDMGQDVDQEGSEIQEDMEMSDLRRQRGSREKSRSPRRRSRRSRSRSRDRRRRSRSRDRHRRSRSRERERRDREKEREKERERERERKKRGLPPLRENHISICSTTLWLGHLTKHTTEDELREHIETYGTIRTINMIPPRGCAFVCLTKRRGAFKALDRLKGIKINGSSLKVAWAPGIGVKESVFKDLWDVELGVTYIPWDQLPAEVSPLIAGGMVDEDSLPERLKGINTGEEEVEDPLPAENASTERADTPHDDMPTQHQPQQMSLGLPGQPPNFPMSGPLGAIGLLNLLAGRPLGLLGGPPPMGLQGALGGGMALGAPNMAGLNSMRLPNNVGGMGNMGGLPGMPGPGPNMPGMRPGQMNVGHQGPMMGQGNRMHSPMGGPNPGIDIRPHPAGMNSPGPRGPFGQFNMPRFQHLQNQGGMRPPFFNSNREQSDQPGMEDGDIRAMAEPKEWPPDDEVNAEDEQDEDLPTDSDERMFPTRGPPSMGRPNMPSMRPLGNLLGPRGMLPGQGPPNHMLGMPRAQSPSPGMPSLQPLRMMPPGQQPPGHPMPGGPGHSFPLAHGGMRLPMPGLRMRPGGPIPGPPSPHLLPPSTRPSLSVTTNGPMLATSPELRLSDMPLSERDRRSPDLVLSGADMPPHPDDDMLRLHPPGFMPLRPMQGPPFLPFHGRGFAPMNFRARGGDGLLGARPDGQGGGGFDRFRGPPPFRPFDMMDRPPFGRRFELPFRPPMGFVDFDDRDDMVEHRLLPRFDFEDHPRLRDFDDRHLQHYIDERRSYEMRGGHPDEDIREDKDIQEDIAQRFRKRDGFGRASRWHDETSNPEPAVDNSPIENEVVPTPSPPPPVEEEDKEAPTPVESNTAASPVETYAAASPVEADAAASPVETDAAASPVETDAAASPVEADAAASPVETDAAASPVETDVAAGKDTETAVTSQDNGTPVELEPAEKTLSEGENQTEVKSPAAEASS